MKKIPLIEVNQPIGTFYISCLPAPIVSKIAKTIRREYDTQKLDTKGGVQRGLNPNRVLEISRYTSDPDATFPTPIIIAVKDDADYRMEENYLIFNETSEIGEIIDGQHRIEGLKVSDKINDFELPVIFMFNLNDEEKAYIFSIINSKQTQVPKSLIYDLFALAEKRSPQKTCHGIARLFNSDDKSPFYKRLKMLGRKEHESASLSQGSFINYLLPLISKNPDDDLINIKLGKKLADDPNLPLRYYFINDEDPMIYKILFNLFKAVETVFQTEWNNPGEYILSKTTGYGAILRAFPELFERGNRTKDLSQSFFESQFYQFKDNLERKDLRLTSGDFPSNEQQQKRLSDIILEKNIQDISSNRA